MGEIRSATVVDVAVAQVDEHVLQYATAEVLVDAVAKIRGDIANNTPKYRQGVGVGVIENVVRCVDVFEDNEPNAKWERGRRHAPPVETFDSSASSYHHIRSGIAEEERRQSLLLHVILINHVCGETAEANGRLLISGPRLVT